VSGRVSPVLRALCASVSDLCATRTAVKLVIKLSMESKNLSDFVGLVLQDFIFHA
jgi:hypothetical protein